MPRHISPHFPRCVVIGLLSTGEAKANEAVDRETRAGREFDGEVSTPHEIARDVLDKHLPTSFPDGTRAEVAVARKEQLMAQLEEQLV